MIGKQRNTPVSPLKSLVANLNLLLAQDLARDHAALCPIVARRLARALRPDWLPIEARALGEGRYGRHLLHEDPDGRYSIGSFVWQPGQATPIHDHTCWGVLGVVQGRLVSENFGPDAGGALQPTSSLVLPAGFTAWLSPDFGDVHRIVNRARQATAISIHVYGAPFSAVCRNQYDDLTGAAAAFRPGHTGQGSRAAQ